MDTILFNIMMTLMFILLFSGVATWGGVFLLCNSFSKKYDSTLLRSPYFTPEEQVNYKEFPLNLHKTVIYMSYFSYSFMSKKRFKNKPEPKIDALTKISSYSIITLALITVFGFLIFLSIVIYLYIKIPV
tara:strand:+ start:1808 stop:2197 length:390 start_codon:yes stop_codon:yes gene_type:complete